MSPLLLLATAAPAAPATESREASPIALVLVLILLVALIFLVRSMNKHLRKIPADFTKPESPPEKAEKSRTGTGGDPLGTTREEKGWEDSPQS
jgi:hypothetical protein